MVTNSKKFLVDLSRPIIVSMESFAYLKESKSVSDDGKDWIITLMEFDSISRNKSEYPKEDTLRSLNESTYVQETMKNRTWGGELEHPPKGSDLDRFMFVEPTRKAWNILKYWDAGSVLKGQIHLSAPLGTSIVLPDIQDLGSNYASSCRFYTPNYVEKTDGNGNKYLVKKYKMYPVTFDCVTIPGLTKSRIIDPNQYNPGPYKSAVSQESFYQIKFDNPANILKEMIMAEESSMILEDYFGCKLKDAKAFLLKNNQIELTREDGGSIIVPLNNYLTSQILN